MKLVNQGTDEAVLEALELANPINLVELYQYLDTLGTGLGTTNANGTYAAETKFYIKPPANKIFYIARVLTGLVYTGNAAASKYGSIDLGANEGISIKKFKVGDVELLDYTKGLLIDSAGSWANQVYDIQMTDFGNGDNFQTFRFDYMAANSLCTLNGSNGEYLAYTLKGDFSPLSAHRFHVQAYCKDI